MGLLFILVRYKQADCWEHSRLPAPAPTSLPLLASAMRWHESQAPPLARLSVALLYLVVLRVRLQEAVLLDGHGWGQRHSISALLSLFFSAALHARGGGFGQRAAAEALVPSPLKSNQRLLLHVGP